MNNKRWIAAVLLLMLLLAGPVLASAAGSVTVEISFRVVNAPSTVVMDAVNGAPAPEAGVFVNTTGGKFRITYTEPGEYSYKVYQRPGPDPDLEYDGVVYDVQVTVYERKDGTLGAVTEVWIPGNPFKAMEIVFENPPGARIDKDQRLNNGRRTKETVKGNPGDRITYYITVTNGSNKTVYDVNVTDEVPARLQLVADSISDGGSEANGVVSWKLGDIAALSSKTVEFTVTVPNVNVASTWTNIAEGSYADSPEGAPKTRAVEDEAERHELRTNEVEAIYAPNGPTTAPDATVTPAPEEGDSTNKNPSGEPGADSDDGNESSTTPQTGDTSQLILWSALMGASLLGIILCFLFLRRKRKNNSEK